MEQLENKKEFKLRKMESPSYKMIITKELEKKIRFVCSKIHNIEWSGVLFYTHKGEFEDGSLVVTAQDMIVLDIGSGADTEFKCSDPDVCSYMIDNDLLNCDMGLIHSHHNMSTFFSGTDQNTLLQEGSDRNIFVSLIVNNEGKYTAGITRKIAAKVTEEVCYRTWGDKEICRPVENYDAKYVEWYNLDIEKEEDEVPFPELAERLLKIAEDKKKAQEEARTYNWVNKLNNWEVPSTFHTYNNKQLSMFENIDDDSTKIVENPIDENHDIEGITFNDLVINDMIVKMLMGDINADSDSMTMSMARANSKLRYSRTFPNFDDFKYFAESFLDVLIQTYAGEAIADVSDKVTEDEMYDENSVLVMHLAEILSQPEYSDNIYLNYFVELLDNYM